MLHFANGKVVFQCQQAVDEKLSDEKCVVWFCFSLKLFVLGLGVVRVTTYNYCNLNFILQYA